MSWIIIEVLNEDKRNSRIIQDYNGCVVFNTEEEALTVAEQFNEAYVVLIE